MPGVTKALDDLLDILDLEPIEVNIFRGRSPDEHRQRVFGGQVAGQALVAAGRTVGQDRTVHSLHAYFLRPGDPLVPILYEVDRIRDGKSFTTRREVALPQGRPHLHPVCSLLPPPTARPPNLQSVGLVPHAREGHRAPAALPRGRARCRVTAHLPGADGAVR